MAKRTYIPQLVNFMRVICKYIVLHRATMVAEGPATISTKLDAIVVACEALLAIIPADLPTDDEYTP